MEINARGLLWEMKTSELSELVSYRDCYPGSADPCGTACIHILDEYHTITGLTWESCCWGRLIHSKAKMSVKRGALLESLNLFVYRGLSGWL